MSPNSTFMSSDRNPRATETPPTALPRDPVGDRTNAQTHTWVDAGRRSPDYGLPGRVQLAPAVWLCCVYLSSQDAERVDANREASRLDTLLRTAADAWRRQMRVAGTQASSCVFCFQPDVSEVPVHAGRKSSPGFLIRLEIDAGETGEITTRLDFAG